MDKKKDNNFPAALAWMPRVILSQNQQPQGQLTAAVKRRNEHKQRMQQELKDAMTRGGTTTTTITGTTKKKHKDNEDDTKSAMRIHVTNHAGGEVYIGSNNAFTAWSDATMANADIVDAAAAVYPVHHGEVWTRDAKAAYHIAPMIVNRGAHHDIITVHWLWNKSFIGRQIWLKVVTDTSRFWNGLNPMTCFMEDVIGKQEPEKTRCWESITAVKNVEKLSVFNRNDNDDTDTDELFETLSNQVGALSGIIRADDLSSFNRFYEAMTHISTVQRMKGGGGGGGDDRQDGGQMSDAATATTDDAIDMDDNEAEEEEEELVVVSDTGACSCGEDDD
eukprot:Seg2628.7 transcript_id=Seg2628.7/GoldUCD/mRNA.D3Y31 product="hypothetical protein" protein_id=Seg2628.7/GoldUCD/D3Y31